MIKKKLLTFCFIFSFCLFAGCTLHFKAEKMELETKPPEAKIGNTTETNTTYKLASLDLLKDN